MDILRATTNAKPQYGVILTNPELPLEAQEHTQLEIGFGNGEYTVLNAEANPGVMFYGVEISRACVLKCARRAAGLRNLRILNADARYMLRELFRDETLERIIMQFPCPWSSNKQAHRRVTAKDFADGLSAVLKVGGKFEMLTDDEAYSCEVREVLGRHEVLEVSGYEINPERELTTKYERKWLEEGKNIYRIEFTKSREFSVWRRIVHDMHIRIERGVSAEAVGSLRNVEGKRNGGQAFWKFGRCFSDGEVYLLETLTSDEEFGQKFYIHVANRGEGALIRLDETADAYLTPAVRYALEDASRRLNEGS